MTEPNLMEYSVFNPEMRQKLAAIILSALQSDKDWEKIQNLALDFVEYWKERDDYLEEDQEIAAVVIFLNSMLYAKFGENIPMFTMEGGSAH